MSRSISSKSTISLIRKLCVLGLVFVLSVISVCSGYLCIRSETWIDVWNLKVKHEWRVALRSTPYYMEFTISGTWPRDFPCDFHHSVRTDSSIWKIGSLNDFMPTMSETNMWRIWWGRGFEECFWEGSMHRADQAFEFIIPHGIFFIASGLFPLIYFGCVFMRRLRHRWRREEGKCLKCGYDLRASKQGCPECGDGRM